MEDNSPTVKTFYSDLADEVDQHFARALHSAVNTNLHAHPQEENQVYESGQCNYSPSLSNSSSPANEMSHEPSCTNLPVKTLMFSSQPITTFSPTQAHTWPLQPSQHISQPYHTTTATFLPPSITNNFSSNNNNCRGAIVYHEFVNHLVHPDVDSFKDIPKLPGQSVNHSSSPISNTPSLVSPDTPQSPSSYHLLHSSLPSNSPVHLSEDDLQQILELNKETMYT